MLGICVPYTQVVRVAKLSKFLGRLAAVTPDRQLFITVFKLVAGLVFLAHIIACLFWFFGCDEDGFPNRDSWIISAGIHDQNIGVQVSIKDFPSFFICGVLIFSTDYIYVCMCVSLYSTWPAFILHS